jgi:hypothetical protein
LGYNTYIHGRASRKSLCSALKQAKMSFLFPFFYKIGEQEGGTGPTWGVDNNGGGEKVGKGCKMENVVQILCTCAFDLHFLYDQGC